MERWGERVGGVFLGTDSWEEGAGGCMGQSLPLGAAWDVWPKPFSQLRWERGWTDRCCQGAAKARGRSLAVRGGSCDALGCLRLLPALCMLPALLPALLPAPARGASPVLGVSPHFAESGGNKDAAVQRWTYRRASAARSRGSQLGDASCRVAVHNEC